MNILKFLIDFIYPRKCGFCGRKINERYTCRKCTNIIEYYHEKVDIYAKQEEKCDMVISAISYDGFIKDKVLQYKFRNAKYLAPSFADILLPKVDKYCAGFDFIIAVPISSKRLRERGYNQSDLIAKYLSRFAKIQYKKDILVKIKNNLRQSELNLNERKENVKDAYSIKNIEVIKGKKIILVDDIYTTGATLNECAKLLKGVGAQKIIGITLMYSELEK
jgi:ComF family protein